MSNAKHVQTPDQGVMLAPASGKPVAYTSPLITAIGAATEILQRRPTGGAADRVARKPVVVAKKTGRAVKKAAKKPAKTR